jgi:hypothetical protein
MKRETCIIGAHLALGARALKFQFSLSLSLAKLSNFLKPPSALALLSPQTPPPPAILDPGLGAHHRLIPGLGAHHCLVLGLKACRRLVPNLTGGPLLDLGFLASPTVLPSPTLGPRCHHLPTRCWPQPLTLPPARLAPSRRCQCPPPIRFVRCLV